MYPGDLVEYGKTNELFTSPRQKQTEECIAG
jgi:ABC-type phosphate transport system ATPase subunit